MDNWISHFHQPITDSTSTGSREFLGGKGASLAEMFRIGMPVPPGFTITTAACRWFYDNQQQLPPEFMAKLQSALRILEKAINKNFGDGKNPLLVSVRSGARVSMPGMMDTILNLGLNDQTVVGLAKLSDDARFAWDCYRRFIQMYGNVVLGLEHYLFEEELDSVKQQYLVKQDTELSAEQLQEIVVRYQQLIQEHTDSSFPQDPWQQLIAAIQAVFMSWQSNRAQIYRRINKIPDDWGTAVNVQSMVFGNMGEDCATGVAFTRDPATGENKLFGEFLINAQGEDVVAGIRNPLPISESANDQDAGSGLEKKFPAAYRQLMEIRTKLEHHYREMQDIEFTIEKQKLFILQTRSGKRSIKSALKIAVDMVADGIIAREDALLRIDASALDQLLHPSIDPEAEKTLIATGLAASPGAASGKLAFTAEQAEKLAKDGQAVILVRTETSPEDILGMHAARGILTSRGGMTSHAAVVARSMGRPCVSGASTLGIDSKQRKLIINGIEYDENNLITIDGNDGSVYLGQVATVIPELDAAFNEIMRWSDAIRTLKIRANADNKEDTTLALRYGAEGIGLCRSEHMFFARERIQIIRAMILAESLAERRKAIKALQPYQYQDYCEILQLMRERPITIRLLDPPLHEFLPHGQQELSELTNDLGQDVDQLQRRSAQLREANPMLGHRGCRLLISYPEIAEMQVSAILDAALAIAKKLQIKPNIEIMVPLVASEAEMVICKRIIDKTIAAANVGKMINVSIGTMIELPRAALQAGELAKHADFFSFGTNDLTQTTWGISRDDSGSFLANYERQGIFTADPFVSVDQTGVGELITIASQRSRSTRNSIKLGVCGEHGGDPQSIKFFNQLGLDYVSCSPFRLPIARLAAAQAAITSKVAAPATS